MSNRIVVIQNFPETAQRMSAIASALKDPQDSVDYVSLDFSRGTGELAVPLTLSLAQYLDRFGNELRLALVDSAQAMLIAGVYLKRACPKIPVLLNLRAGPLLEFLGGAPSLAAAIRSGINAASAVILNGPAEAQLLGELGISPQNCCEVATPLSAARNNTKIRAGTVSLQGDFAHPPVMAKLNLLQELLRSNPLPELEFFCEGNDLTLTQLPPWPADCEPEVRVFLAAAKEYDNISILNSLFYGSAVVASDGACFGLGLTHLKEYLAANHPLTIRQSLSRLIHDPSTRSNLVAAGRNFVELNHNQGKFLKEIGSLKECCSRAVTRRNVASDHKRLFNWESL